MLLCTKYLVDLRQMHQLKVSVTLPSQLPHSYYFTTRILVLKFANKGVYFEEIQDLHFPRKRGYFGTHLRKLGEKGVNFYV